MARRVCVAACSTTAGNPGSNIVVFCTTASHLLPSDDSSGLLRQEVDTCVYISGGEKYDRKFVKTIIVFDGDAILGWLKKNPQSSFVFSDNAVVQERLTADGLSFSVVKLYVGDMYFISAGCLHCIITERGVLHSCVGWKPRVNRDASVATSASCSCC